MSKTTIKHWFQRKTRGWSDDELWNLDYTFVLWINTRFKEFKKQADSKIDLNYHKFKYKNKTYTQLQMINKIIDISNYLAKESNYYNDSKVTIEKINELIDMFKLIYPAMWW